MVGGGGTKIWWGGVYWVGGIFPGGRRGGGISKFSANGGGLPPSPPVGKTLINCTKFNLLLNTIWDGLVLTPTNFVLKPTSPDRQLVALLYRLAHGATHTVMEDVFGISKESDAYFSTR